MRDMYVRIMRNSDKKIRIYKYEKWAEWTNEFWWEGGNMSCDCNRRMIFDEAGGEETSEEIECGRGAYTIISITYDDDPKIYYSEEYKT